MKVRITSQKAGSFCSNRNRTEKDAENSRYVFKAIEKVAEKHRCITKTIRKG